MSPGRIPVIDLKRQYHSIKAEVDEAVRRVVESGYYVGGPEVRAFEEEWAQYCGMAHCVALGNGTAALNLTLRALGIGPGDEVVTVAFTLSATLDAIADTGARPVLIDIDPGTYTMDAGLVAAALSPRTKAIMPVHIYGHAADMGPILETAVARGLPVIGDSCEAHGTLYKGRQVNGMGTANCFSFYPTKNLNAMGDAGAVVTNDAALADRIRMLRVHGWDSRFHSAVAQPQQPHGRDSRRRPARQAALSEGLEPPPRRDRRPLQRGCQGNERPARAARALGGAKLLPLRRRDPRP